MPAINDLNLRYQLREIKQQFRLQQRKEMLMTEYDALTRLEKAFQDLEGWLDRLTAAEVALHGEQRGSKGVASGHH